MVKTLCFHHRGRGFDLWSGNKDPMCHAARPKNKNKKEEEFKKYKMICSYAGESIGISDRNDFEEIITSILVEGPHPCVLDILLRLFL